MTKMRHNQSLHWTPKRPPPFAAAELVVRWPDYLNGFTRSGFLL